MTKRTYKAPRLTVYGKLENLTKQSSDGSKLDHDFSSGTEKGDLTFS